MTFLALLFTGTCLREQSKGFEVMLLKTGSDAKREKQRISVLLDDKHPLKQQIGVPQKKSWDCSLSDEENPETVEGIINQVVCKRFEGWMNPTAWWIDYCRSTEEKLADLTEIVKQLMKQNKEILQELHDLKEQVHSKKKHKNVEKHKHSRPTGESQ
eukprot:TRINITY_DN6485_c0_g1_i4.p1 TRINITY_DN6485_c0_g1~~TRINITY_DN6485_c0_g1_i4.p1  ORF type:complete len:157 (-),score=42.04 TRINITY_DN6485_c0_g1_i4:105-575(-)